MQKPHVWLVEAIDDLLNGLNEMNWLLMYAE